LGVVDCDYPGIGSTPSTGDRACDALAGYDGPTGWGAPKGLLEFEQVNFGVISLPASVTHGVAALFRATKSTDPYPGGTIASYTWNWGDGTAPSTGASQPHTYASAGRYTLSLVIMDSYGAKSVNSVSVLVR
jgi:PKD repeat protein